MHQTLCHILWLLVSEYVLSVDGLALLCSDEKLQQLGMSASDMMKAMHSNRIDYTTQDTQGYRQQEAKRGEAAKKRCIQALAGFCEPVIKLIEGEKGAHACKSAK